MPAPSNEQPRTSLSATAADAAVVGKEAVGLTVGIVEDFVLMADLIAAVCHKELHAIVSVRETHGQPALARLSAYAPQVILLDIALPDIDGLDLASELRQLLPSSAIIVISALRDPVTFVRMRNLQLHGFIDKREISVEVFKQAILSVSRGQRYFSGAMAEALADLWQDPNAFFRVLSDYEQEILGFIGLAKDDMEIASLLEIAASTVQSHRRDIMRKLGIHTTPKLQHFAREMGFARPAAYRLGGRDRRPGGRRL
jgi:DNA-binding NarL/FixJ family response regulator